MTQPALTDETWNEAPPDPLNRNHHREAVGAVPPVRIRYTHDAMIDMIIANPGVHQNQLAVHFGYTPAWVSTIMSSDAFRARLSNRREEIVDPLLVITTEERFKALTDRSLAVLADKLSVNPASVPDNLALRCAELGAKALGIGGNAPPPVTPAASDYLNTLAQHLVALRSKVYSEPLSGEYHEVKAA